MSEDDTASNTWSWRGGPVAVLNTLTLNGLGLDYYRESAPPVDSFYTWNQIFDKFDNIAPITASPSTNLLAINDSIRVYDGSGNFRDITPFSNPATNIDVNLYTDGQSYYPALIRFGAGNQREVFVDASDNLIYNPLTQTMRIRDGSANIILIPNNLRLTDVSNNILNITATSNPATSVSITDSNTNATFYPVFVDSAGNNKTLNADITTSPLSYNPSTGTLSTSNLTISGTGVARRILGDFTSGNQNRTIFQTTTANNTTYLTPIPSGTGNTAGMDAYNSSSVTDCPRLRVEINNTQSLINSTFTGTSSALPISIQTAGVERIGVSAAGNTTITGSTSNVGNLTISGSTRRILADFTTSNAPRCSFQTTTTDGATIVGVIPNGTNTNAGIDFYNASGVTNCSILRVQMTNTAATINSTNTGSGSNLPLALQTQGIDRISISDVGNTTVSGNLTISGTGRRIQADFNNGAQSNRLAFQTSTANQFTSVNAIPNGTNTSASWEVFNSSSMANCGRANFGITTTAATLRSESLGSGTTVPLVLAVNVGPAMTIDTSNVALFANVPTCTTSATTTNQLVNWNNFTQSSFTPTLISSGGGVPTYTRQAGRFIRIGNWCMFDGEIETSAVNTLAAGSLSVLLPQTNDSASRAAITIGLLNGISSSYHNCASFVGLSDDKAQLEFRPQSTDDNFTDITVADVDFANFRIIYSGSYTCA